MRIKNISRENPDRSYRRKWRVAMFSLVFESSILQLFRRSLPENLLKIKSKDGQHTKLSICLRQHLPRSLSRRIPQPQVRATRTPRSLVTQTLRKILVRMLRKQRMRSTKKISNSNMRNAKEAHRDEKSVVLGNRNSRTT